MKRRSGLPSRFASDQPSVMDRPMTPLLWYTSILSWPNRVRNPGGIMRLVVIKLSILFLVLALGSAALADSKKSNLQKDQQQQAQVDPNADKIFYQEAKMVENMHKFTPLVETYIQNMKRSEERRVGKECRAQW